MIGDSKQGDGQHRLGPVLFERHRDAKSLSVFLVIGCLALAAGTMFLAISPFAKSQKELIEGLGMGGGGVFVAAVIGAVCWFEWNSILRCHRQGISKTTPLGTYEVRYEDIESFSYRKSAQFYQGIYIGTGYHLGFTPRRAVGSRSFHVTVTQRKDQDISIEDLRNYVASRIAEAMLDELERTGSLAWTQNMRFVHSGVEYLGKPNWQLLPFDRVGRRVIIEGIFYLRDLDADFPVAYAHDIYPNFYPGLLVLENCIHKTLSD